MNQQKKNVMPLLVLFTICGLIIWQAIYLQSVSMYQEMFRWLETDKAYLTMLYNIGIMVVLGFALSLLMLKLTDLLGVKGRHAKDSDKGVKANIRK